MLDPFVYPQYLTFICTPISSFAVSFLTLRPRSYLPSYWPKKTQNRHVFLCYIPFETSHLQLQAFNL